MLVIGVCIRDIFLIREDSSGVRLRTFGMIFQSARKAAANWQHSSFHCSPLFHLLRSVIIFINNRNALLRFFDVCFATFSLFLAHLHRFCIRQTKIRDIFTFRVSFTFCLYS